MDVAQKTLEFALEGLARKQGALRRVAADHLDAEMRGDRNEMKRLDPILAEASADLKSAEADVRAAREALDARPQFDFATPMLNGSGWFVRTDAPALKATADGGAIVSDGVESLRVHPAQGDGLITVENPQPGCVSATYDLGGFLNLLAGVPYSCGYVILGQATCKMCGKTEAVYRKAATRGDHIDTFHGYHWKFGTRVVSRAFDNDFEGDCIPEGLVAEVNEIVLRNVQAQNYNNAMGLHCGCCTGWGESWGLCDNPAYDPFAE